MQIGMLGLGRMGGKMTERLLKGGHQVVAYNRTAEPLAEAVRHGAVAAENLADTVRRLSGRRVVWIMIPSGDPVESAVRELSGLLSRGDIVIDGGNSYFRDSVRRAALLKDRGILFLDSGTSGGIWGLTEGYCLMVGGEAEAFAFVEPVLKTLAPDKGYLHTGAVGSGHFTKMVHNGIEYGLMQAYAEGFELLEQSDFKLDLTAISELWQHGSVVRSWLLSLATDALQKDPDLADVEAWVDDSGEGRWTVLEGVHYGVPMPAISAALYARFASRHDNPFGLRLISALRNEFGGHTMKKREA
jgi:6-phosphogluconate dehydrogenase